MNVLNPGCVNIWSQIKQIRFFFLTLEVVGRGGETQVQVGEELKIT